MKNLIIAIQGVFLKLYISYLSYFLLFFIKLFVLLNYIVQYVYQTPFHIINEYIQLHFSSYSLHCIKIKCKKYIFGILYM